MAFGNSFKYLLIVFTVIVIKFASASQTYIQYVDSADYYIKKSKWDKAEEMTIKALKSRPANKLNYLLWSNLGDIRTNLCNHSGAIEAFDIALASQPENARILSKRAYAYLSAGDKESAVKDIDQSLRIDSVQEWPLQVKAMMALEDSDLPLAEKYFNSLKNHFDKNAEAYIGLGKIMSAKGLPEESELMFRKAISTEDSEEARFLLVLTLIQSEKLPKAKEELLIALKRYPRDGNLYLLRGMIHKLNFENDAAAMDKKIALDFGADKRLVNQLLPASNPSNK